MSLLLAHLMQARCTIRNSFALDLYYTWVFAFVFSNLLDIHIYITFATTGSDD